MLSLENRVVISYLSDSVAPIFAYADSLTPTFTFFVRINKRPDFLFGLLFSKRINKVYIIFEIFSIYRVSRNIICKFIDIRDI